MRDAAGSVPRTALITAAATLVLALLGATYGALTPHASPPTATAIARRALRFEDGSDGSVKVLDGRTGLSIATLAPGTNGFIRGTLRGLASARRLRSLDGSRGDGPRAPFLLTAWDDGRLTLEDPVDGRDVDLEAFGSTNVGAFSALLTAPETRP